MSALAERASRVTIGHAEGMPLAFANLYLGLADAIRTRREGRVADPALACHPSAEDGLRSMAAVHAVVKSAHAQGAWVDAVPSLLTGEAGA